MPFSYKLQETINIFKGLDTSQQSLDENLKYAPKNSLLMNFFCWIVSVLFCGSRSSNPNLDRATDKVITQIEPLLTSKIPPDVNERKEITDLLTKLVCVIDGNLGSKKSKVTSLLARINRVSHSLNPESSSNAIPNSLADFLEPLANKSFQIGEMQGVQERLVEALHRFTDVPLLTCKKQKAFLIGHLLIPVGNTIENLVRHVSPQCLRAIVDANWIRQDKDLFTRICKTLMQEPVEEEKLCAFVEGMANYRSALEVEKGRSANLKPECITGLLSSPAFYSLFDRLSEKDKTSLIQSLASYGAESLELDDNNHVPRKVETWTTFANRLYPSYRELVYGLLLDRVTKNNFLAHICVNCLETVSFNPFESALKQISLDEDSFNEFIFQVCSFSRESGNQFIAFEHLSLAVFREEIPHNIHSIFFTYVHCIPSLLTHCLPFIKENFLNQISTPTLLTVLKDIDNQPSCEKSSKIILNVLENREISSWALGQNEDLLWKFAENSQILKSQIMGLRLIRKLFLNDAQFFSYMDSVKDVSPEVWFETGRRLDLKEFERNFQIKHAQSLVTSQNSKSIIAFANGLAKQIHAKHDETEVVVNLLMGAICNSEFVASELCEELSPTALRCLKLSTMVGDRPYSENLEDYIWYQIIIKMDLNQLSPKEVCLISHFANQSYKSIHRIGQGFFFNLPSHVLTQLFIDCPAPIYPILQICSGEVSRWQSSPECSQELHVFRQRVRAFSMTEQSEFRRAVNEINSLRKFQLIQALHDESELNPSPVVSALTLNFLSSKPSVSDALQLPRKLLLDQFKEVYDEEWQFTLLGQLHSHDVVSALNQLWTPTFCDHVQRLFLKNFPFFNTLFVLDDPTKIVPLATVTTGFSWVRSLIANPSKGGTLRDTLSAFEYAPWKLCLSLPKMDVESLHAWAGGVDNPRQAYPKCWEILEWYTSEKKNQIINFHKELKQSILIQDWETVRKKIEELDSKDREFLLAPIMGPSTQGLAENLAKRFELEKIEEINKPSYSSLNDILDNVIVMAIFDAEGNQKLEELIQSGQLTKEVSGFLVNTLNKINSPNPNMESQKLMTLIDSLHQ